MALAITLLLALAGAVSAAPLSLPAADAAWLAKHGPVRMAPDPDLAPVEFIDGRGRHRGLSADLSRMLAERSGMQLDMVIRDRFDDVLPALEKGEIDVASSVFKSPGRIERFLFSTPYLRLPAALIGRRGGPVATVLADLRGRPIAVVKGHVWQELLTTAGYASEQRPYPSIGEALAAVAAGEADAYVGDLLTADHAMRRGKLTELLVVSGETRLEAELAYAIRRDLPQLKSVLDQALASISVEEEKNLRATWEGVEATTELDAEADIPESALPAIKELRAQLDAKTDLPEAERNALTQRLDTALRFEAATDESIARIERIRREATQAALEGAALQSAAAAAAADPVITEDLLRWRGSLPQRASLDQLEQLLAVERNGRDSLKEGVDRALQQIQELQQRPMALRRETLELRARLDELTLPGESADFKAQIERAAVQAEMRSLRAALAAASVEQSQADTLLQAANARRRERQRLLAQRSGRVAILEQLVAERGDSQLAEELDVLRKQAQDQADALPAIRELADQNVATGEALSQGTRRLAQLREQASALESGAGEVTSALQNARARIAIGGVTESIGMLLLAERRRLPNVRSLQARLTALQRETADVRMAQITVTEESERLGDLGSTLARLSTDDESELVTLPEARAVMTELLLVRGELLPRQLQLQQRMLDVLGQSEETLIRLLADSQALTQLMDQNLLWIPSHPPINADWMRRFGAAWQDLSRVDRWLPTLKRVRNGLAEKPLWILVLLLPLGIAILRGRLGQALRERAVRVRNLQQDRMRHTLEALALTVLIALPVPLLFLLLARLLQLVGEVGQFTHSLGVAIQIVVPYGFLFGLIAVVCRDDGLAHAHLRWLKARREALLKVHRYVQFAVMPLAFVMALSLVRGVDSANATVLRTAAILLALVLAGIAHWLLAPGRLFASRVGGSDPRPLVRRALRVGLVTVLLGMVALAVFGYVITVATLTRVLLDSLQVLFAVALMYGLALRSLVIGQRRIAQAQSTPSPDSEPAAAAMDAPVVGSDSVNLRTISEQSRKLLRALTVIALGTGLLWSLAAVAPAFSMLDKVVLWETQEIVDGATQAGVISLGDAVLALLALLLGIVAARNIPGLLEILLTNTFTKDASVRYAAVAVTRYLIVISMVFAVFGFLGVRWGDLQWLAAAISVGLGFGLQEIFANFVAGLILLFERPFRVGDVVSIADLSGTVRRVQTRATTIVDWDGKDIIIPNKALITERFVNWTLSDTVTRIVIKVGVGYDSDPAQVREELLNLARAHPAVLYDPAPMAVFMALAGSTLDFELRCFVRDIGDRLRAIDDLNGQIVIRFRERGIRIAYPQMEVHMHQAAAAGAVPAQLGAASD